MPKLPKTVASYFPYPNVRPHQDTFTKTVYETVKKGKHVVIEGSNGLGKTIAVLSACLPVAKEQGLKIIYTAKTHRQHDRVIEELRAVSRKQMVSGISIRGRQAMCFHPFIVRHAPDARSTMEICELLKARGQCPYYEKISANPDRYADLQLHISSKPFTALEIQEICKDEGFCPYELIKLLVGEVDVVALSYLYIFDPVIRSVFLKNLEKPLSRILLIVDEAHNLPNTALEIESDSLSLFILRLAEREAKEHNYKDVVTFTAQLRAYVEKMATKVEKETWVSPDFLVETIKTEMEIEEPPTFFEYLHDTGNLIKRSYLTQGKYPRSYIHRVGEFLLKWLDTAKDTSFTHVLSKYIAKTGQPSARLEVVALDPSKITEPVFSSVNCSVTMSGTLEPLEAFIKITRLPETTITKVVPSPFPKKHILSLVCCGVTTAMKQRTQPMYNKLAKRIAEAIRHSPNTNIGVFAASYEVLQRILDTGLENAVEKKFFIEKQGMSSRHNDLLIKQFKSYAEKGGAVLLGVQGGRASEGADYPGKQMETVVVVGVPYAQPSPRVEAQIRYYDTKFPGHGREYGYVLPALRRASQAAGRPIRSLDDRGAIIFLDYRFSTAYCRRYLPIWMGENMKTLPDKPGVIAKELMSFFGLKQPH